MDLAAWPEHLLHGIPLGRPGRRGLFLAAGAIEIGQRRLVDAAEIAGQLRSRRRGRQCGVETVVQLIGGDALLVGGELAGIVGGDREQRAPVERRQIDGRLAGIVERPFHLGRGVEAVECGPHLRGHDGVVLHRGHIGELRTGGVRQRQVGRGIGRGSIVAVQRIGQRRLRRRGAGIGGAVIGIGIGVAGIDRCHERSPLGATVKKPLRNATFSVRG